MLQNLCRAQTFMTTSAHTLLAPWKAHLGTIVNGLPSHLNIYSVSDDQLSLISSGGASYLQFLHLPLLINSTIVLLFLFDRPSIFKKK